MWRLVLPTLLLCSCGFPPPREVKPNTYELDYCQVERDCFEAAEKTCPNGFRVTKWMSSRAHIFVCE